MSPPTTVSIIICTRDNAASLRHTLEAIAACDVPNGWSAELVVVDNGSTDSTAAVVHEAINAAAATVLPVRYVYEPRSGKGHAYNSGIAVAKGEVLIFTDDDTEPPANWIIGMASPLLSGTADLLSGGVNLGPAVNRAWIRPPHQFCLACTDGLESWFVGANMAVARRIFDKVPAFDPELGPGASGFGDESLFVEQAKVAGFRLKILPEVAVIHNPRPDRLRYRRWIDAAERQGRSSAYAAYHWQHFRTRLPWCRAAVARAVLSFGRALRVWKSADPEFADAREMAWCSSAAYFAGLARLRGQPRNYDRLGLVKRHGKMP